MGYLHIPNLHKDQTILLMRECYALEKIHGTSAAVSWRQGRVWFSSGGEDAARFRSLFDEVALAEMFDVLGHGEVAVHGEAYGGKQQAQAWRYGPDLRFVAFDVRIGEHWLAVPQAEDVAKKLNLEFVSYRKVSTDLAALDAARDAPSEQARRNGVAGDPPMEGVVLRPLIELRTNNGERVIAKYKRDEERETATPRRVVDPGRMQVLADADAIALEWVTATRLEHVLDKIPGEHGMNRTGEVTRAMIEDVLREGAGELVDSKEARVAIAKRAAKLFHRTLVVGCKRSEDAPSFRAGRNRT